MKHKYLINPRKPKAAAHIMRGKDTACRMLSTGGIPGHAYEAADKADGRRICHMCQRVIGFHVAVSPPPGDHLTKADLRRLRLFAAPGASVAVGLSVHAMLAQSGYLTVIASERQGKRYVITEAGLAAVREAAE